MRIFVVICGLLICRGPLMAQDNHYWSQMGGISAGLLGGSAIAGLKDNSSLYYNAAAMSFVNNPSISIGANTYRLRLLNIDRAFGEDLNTFSNQFVINPDLIGGLLFSKKNDILRFGYAINTRFLSQNHTQFQSVRNLENGDQFVGDFDIRSKTMETWFNSANSYKLNDHSALGYTLILAIRSQHYSNFIGTKIIPSNDQSEVARMDSRIDYNYWNVKGLLRLSYALDYERFRLGWNVTLPSLNLFGRAFAKREYSLVNNPNLLNDLPSDLVVTGNQERINAKHKYPFSTGLGASFKLNNKDWIHFSTEMFLPVEKYSIFNSDNELVAFPKGSFDSLAVLFPEEVTFMELNDAADFVINFSVGYENFISDNWGILAGFRTDFNKGKAPIYSFGEMTPNKSQLDIFHLSGGAWGYYKEQKVTAGLEVGLSPQKQMRQWVNFNNPNSPDYPLTGAPEFNATASQLILRIFLGIEINFVHKPKEIK